MAHETLYASLGTDPRAGRTVGPRQAVQLGLQLRDALLGRAVSSGICLHHVRARRLDRSGLNQRLHSDARQRCSITADVICWDVESCLQLHGDHPCAISIACTTSAGSALMGMALANARTHMSILQSSNSFNRITYKSYCT